jgi:hypothetical protein
MDKPKRYQRGDAIYFAPAINFEPIDQNCAFEYVKAITFVKDKLTVEYTNSEERALRLPIPLMDQIVDFLNWWNKKGKITHIKE